MQPLITLIEDANNLMEKSAEGALKKFAEKQLESRRANVLAKVA